VRVRHRDLFERIDRRLEAIDVELGRSVEQHDDLRVFIREMNVRAERVTRELVGVSREISAVSGSLVRISNGLVAEMEDQRAEMQGQRAEMQGQRAEMQGQRAEMADQRAQARAETQAILKLLDRFTDGSPPA